MVWFGYLLNFPHNKNKLYIYYSRVLSSCVPNRSEIRYARTGNNIRCYTTELNNIRS